MAEGVISESLDLLGLFIGAFLAATVLPMSSEIALGAMALADRASPVVLLVVASAGNISGSVVNWLLGRFLITFRDRPWFPVGAEALEKAADRFRRYGLWSLLFAWVPIIGDPLTLAAGLLRAPFLPFLVLVTIGKTARYAALLWIVD